jgi:flavodoxin
MNALVIHDSLFGNTAQVAAAIARVLREGGDVDVAGTDDVGPAELLDSDLLVVGGPTQHHSASPPMRDWLDNLVRSDIEDKLVAAFDTRYEMHPWVSGSAGRFIARRLRKLGGLLIAPAESFFVVDREGPLKEGELEHARDWGRELLAEYRSRTPAAP